MTVDDTQLIVRAATQADLPAIVRLLADDGLGRGREAPLEPLPNSYKEAFADMAGDPNNHLFIAESGGSIIATFQMTYIRGLSQQGAKRAHIEAVRIDSSFRGRGFGTQLMAWAITEARKEGCKLMQLTTHTSRLEAHRFYESLGFTPSHVGMKLTL